MFKWLKEVFKKIGNSKFVEFLKEVFAGKTGEFLDENYKSINAAVKLAEEIGEYIAANKEKPYDELKFDINEKFVCNVDDEDIEEIDEDKATGKFKLAYKLSVNFIKEDGKDFVEKLGKAALKLGIELAVNRFFKK